MGPHASANFLYTVKARLQHLGKTLKCPRGNPRRDRCDDGWQQRAARPTSGPPQASAGPSHSRSQRDAPISLFFLTTVVSDGRSVEMVAFGCDTLSASSALSCPPNPSDAISCRFRAMHPGSNPTGCTKPATACECYEIIRRKFDELKPASSHGDIDSSRNRHR